MEPLSLQVGVLHTNQVELGKRNAGILGPIMAAAAYSLTYLLCGMHCHKVSTCSHQIALRLAVPPSRIGTRLPFGSLAAITIVPSSVHTARWLSNAGGCAGDQAVRLPSTLTSAGDLLCAWSSSNVPGGGKTEKLYSSRLPQVSPSSKQFQSGQLVAFSAIKHGPCNAQGNCTMLDRLSPI